MRFASGGSHRGFWFVERTCPCFICRATLRRLELLRAQSFAFLSNCLRLRYPMDCQMQEI